MSELVSDTASDTVSMFVQVVHKIRGSGTQHWDPSLRTDKSSSVAMRRMQLPTGQQDPAPSGRMEWLHKQLRKRARTGSQLFIAADANRDNKLTFSEFTRGVCMMGIRPVPSQTEMRELFSAYGERCLLCVSQTSRTL